MGSMRMRRGQSVRLLLLALLLLLLLVVGQGLLLVVVMLEPRGTGSGWVRPLARSAT